MNALATLYYPSLNPIGRASIIALILVVVLWSPYSTSSRIACVVVLCAPAPLALFLRQLAEGFLRDPLLLFSAVI